MEELRKDAKKLAYTNLFIPLVFMVLSSLILCSIFSIFSRFEIVQYI